MIKKLYVKKADVLILFQYIVLTNITRNTIIARNCIVGSYDYVSMQKKNTIFTH